MGTEARGHTTSHGHTGTTLRGTSSDVIMAVNGLTSPFAANISLAASMNREGFCPARAEVLASAVVARRIDQTHSRDRLWLSKVSFEH